MKTFFLSLFLTAYAFGINDAMKVRITGNSWSDETVVRFLPGATQGFDGSWDAHKFFSLNPNVPQVWSKSFLTDLAINALPPLLRDTTVELQTYIPVAGTYTLQGLEIGAFAQGVSIVLEEIASGNTYDLRSGNTFSFTMDTCGLSSPARFLIHFGVPPVITSTGNINASAGFSFFTAEDHVMVSNPSGHPFSFQIYAMSGIKVSELRSSENEVRFSLPWLSPGIYILRAEDGEMRAERKFLIVR